MYKKHNPIGQNEINAALEVLKSGILSDFLGAEGSRFKGGKYVNKFEEDICNYFQVKNAISVNSWTSGLICAVGAIDLGPGDEVITTPWTMCATATSIIHWNAIPVFADIDPNTFCISAESIKSCLSEKTKAVICVDIFGQSANYEAIKSVVPSNVKIICDTAQAPGALRNSKFVGTFGDIGGFSLNYHKHIHTGEGGVIVTDNDEMAEKCRLIRNHAEAVLEKRENVSLSNMIGYNFRLGEIEAAIASEQLKRLSEIIEKRSIVGDILNEKLKGRDEIITPFIDPSNTHVYYKYALKVKNNKKTRNQICQALINGGFPKTSISQGYANIHQLPLFQKKQAYGTSKIPWSLGSRHINYDKGICPVAESLHEEKLFTIALNHYDLNKSDAIELSGKINKILDAI